MSFSGGGSSSRPSQRHLQTLPISFTQWGKGLVFEWYNELSKSSSNATAIDKLQIRKDISGVVPHRFVVLYMRDGMVHRLDRRPDLSGSDAVDPAGHVDLLKNNPVPTKDECVCDLDKESLKEIGRTNNEIELFLDGKVDLKVVLSTCFAISRDNSAQKYSLFANNCFFFSWTILMVVSRVYLPYKTPQQEQLLRRADSHIRRLTAVIVDEAVTLFLDLVVETVTIFRNKAQAGQAIHQGMHPMIRLAWSLPIGVLQFSWRRMFSARLHFGLRRQLKQHISDVLETRAIVLCANALRRHNTPLLMDGHLWLSELHRIVGPAVRAEMINIFWGAIFDAISEGFGKIDPSMLAKEVTDPSLKFAFLGRRTAQFYAVWNAALHGGLRAAREAAGEEEREVQKVREQEITRIMEYKGTPDELASMMTRYDAEMFPKYNEKMFDLAWNAARQGALASAKIVAQETRDQMKHKEKRDRMWTAIWDIWDDCWAEVHPTARKKSTDTLDKIVRKVLETSVAVVIEELGDSGSHFVLAKIQNSDPVAGNERKFKWRQWWHPLFSERRMTNGTLQEFMKNMMKKDTLSGQKLENINETMSRIWIEARKYSVVPVTP